MHDNKRYQQVGNQFVQAAEAIAQALVDQPRQRAIERDVVIAQQPAADLQGEQSEQAED